MIHGAFWNTYFAANLIIGALFVSYRYDLLQRIYILYTNTFQPCFTFYFIVSSFCLSVYAAIPVKPQWTILVNTCTSYECSEIYQWMHNQLIWTKHTEVSNWCSKYGETTICFWSSVVNMLSGFPMKQAISKVSITCQHPSFMKVISVCFATYITGLCKNIDLSSSPKMQ